MFFHVTQPQPLDLEIISIHVGIGLTIFNIINKHISLNFETQHSKHPTTITGWNQNK